MSSITVNDEETVIGQRVDEFIHLTSNILYEEDLYRQWLRELFQEVYTHGVLDGMGQAYARQKEALCTTMAR